CDRQAHAGNLNHEGDEVVVHHVREGGQRQHDEIHHRIDDDAIGNACQQRLPAQQHQPLRGDDEYRRDDEHHREMQQQAGDGGCRTASVRLAAEQAARHRLQHAAGRQAEAQPVDQDGGENVEDPGDQAGEQGGVQDVLVVHVVFLSWFHTVYAAGAPQGSVAISCTATDLRELNGRTAVGERVGGGAGMGFATPFEYSP